MKSKVALLDLPNEILEQIIQVGFPNNHATIALTSKLFHALLANVFKDHLKTESQAVINPRSHFFAQPESRLDHRYYGKDGKKILDNELKAYITTNTETLNPSQIDFLRSAFLKNKIAANEISFEEAIEFTLKGYAETIKNIQKALEGQKLNLHESRYLKSYPVAYRIFKRELSIDQARAEVSPEMIKKAFHGQIQASIAWANGGIHLGLSLQEINAATFSDAHVKAVQKGMEYKTIADLLSEQVIAFLEGIQQGLSPQVILGLNRQQIKGISRGLTREEVLKLQDYHWKAIEKGLKPAVIRELNANQVKGMVEFNLTEEQVMHPEFSIFHLEALRRGFQYADIQNYTRPEVKELLERPSSFPAIRKGY